MPCIRVQTSCAMSETAKTNIKSALGEAIAVIPGKSENWLMVVLEDNATIYFKGNDSEASAYVNVGVYGSPNERAFNALTGEICKILHDELGIADLCPIQHNRTLGLERSEFLILLLHSRK